MDIQIEGGFNTVMSWKGKGEVKYLWDVWEEGLFQFPPLERYGSSVSYILSCMVNRYFNIFTILFAALQNFDYT